VTGGSGLGAGQSVQAGQAGGAGHCAATTGVAIETAGGTVAGGGAVVAQPVTAKTSPRMYLRKPYILFGCLMMTCLFNGREHGIGILDFSAGRRIGAGVIDIHHLVDLAAQEMNRFSCSWPGVAP